MLENNLITHCVNLTSIQPQQVTTALLSTSKQMSPDSMQPPQRKCRVPQYARRKLEAKHYDYFIFGHRHLAMKIPLSDTSTYFNLGDWISQYTYGVFDGKEFTIQEFEATKTN